MKRLFASLSSLLVLLLVTALGLTLVSCRARERINNSTPDKDTTEEIKYEVPKKETEIPPDTEPDNTTNGNIKDPPDTPSKGDLTHEILEGDWFFTVDADTLTEMCGLSYNGIFNLIAPTDTAPSDFEPQTTAELLYSFDGNGKVTEVLYGDEFDRFCRELVMEALEYCSDYSNACELYSMTEYELDQYAIDEYGSQSWVDAMTEIYNEMSTTAIGEPSDDTINTYEYTIDRKYVYFADLACIYVDGELIIV